MTSWHDSALVTGAEPTIESVERRAGEILKVRPAYGEIVDFYLRVFRVQLAWQGKVRARAVRDSVADCLGLGVPLASRLDPGLDVSSLLGLWQEMKAVFGGGNKVLGKLAATVDKAESHGNLDPGPWLSSLRPWEPGLVEEAARRIGVDADALLTLARAVTVPHWRAVAHAWLGSGALLAWKHFECPVCGDRPALGELRTGPQGQTELKVSPERVMHCAFCGTAWAAASLACPGCASSDAGDAKYYFSPDDRAIRIDFCKRCKCYLKVIDGSLVVGPLYVALELVASAHVDRVAVGRGLKPLSESGRPVTAGVKEERQ